jgi:hypothetical protein
MSIPPVTPVTRAAFFPRPKSSRYFSQQQPTNRRHKMSNNNTDTVTIQENSEDNTVNIPMEIEFTAKLGVPQELIDEGNRALRRFKWTLITIVGGYIALNILAAYLQVSS